MRACGIAFFLLIGCGGERIDPAPAFAGLESEVEVRRDEWGVPHVYAHGLSDSSFVLGYETARDRLFQLDWNRRRVLGRTAELVGEAGLENDRLARIVGFAALGEAGARDLQEHDPELYRAASAYAAGISQFMADAAEGRDGAALPPEYADVDPDYRPEPWRVADSIALLKAELFLLAAHPESDLLAWAIAQTAGQDVANDLNRPDPLEPVYVTPGFPAGCCAKATSLWHGGGEVRIDSRTAAAAARLAELLARFSGRRRVGPVGASNNWAVAAGKSRSGAPLLANDPHLEIDLPTNFYEMHVEVDDPSGGMHAAGFGFPGAPAVALGHDEAAAWGVTTVEADIADSYLETVSGDATTFGGELVPMQIRGEVIRVRRAGARVGDVDEVETTVRVVPHHGPVLSDASKELALLLGPGKAISMRWLGFGVTHEARAFFDLQRARSFDDFRAALDHFEAGLFNFVYAGADGVIGYYPHASYPIRARLDPKLPPYGVVPGTGEYEWTGALIPNECIPQARAPESGRVWTANNDPAGVSADGSTLDDAYYLGGTFDYGLRAARIGERLAALDQASPGDFEAIQGDVRSRLADHFLPPLLAAAAGAKLSAGAAALLAELSAWDRFDRPDAVAPTIFAAFYSQLLVDVFADDLTVTFATAASDDRLFAGVLAHALAGQATPSGHDWLGGKKPAEVLVAALEAVALSLPAALGPKGPAWAWGAVHRNTFDHPLGGKYDLGPIALGGGLASIAVARYAPTAAGKPVIAPDVTEAPNARIVVELASGNPTMRAVLPTGESGVLGDPHYADQLPLWQKAKLRDAHYRRDDVEAHTATRRVFRRGFPRER